MQIVCRQATIADVGPLVELIQHYAEQGIMLPRSREAIEKRIATFVVAEADEVLVGCGSLFQLGADLVEIRSLGILDGYKGYGIGSRIVNALLDEALRLGIPKVMALTYEAAFFQKNGFEVVQKEIFPEKVWTDCIHCKKQHNCDEIAVLKVLPIA